MQPPLRKPVAAAAYVFGVVVALTIARPASAQPDPDSSAAQDSLLAQIAELDARYFDAHNRCDLEALRGLLAPDMKAYHDLGGYLEGREAFMEVMQGTVPILNAVAAS